MTHKQRCIDNCMQYLEQLQLAYTFSTAAFNHYYRKNNGCNGNAFHVGMHAADTIILNYNPSSQNLDNETTID